MRRESGFTLIEVLVVILITSILLTLSAFAVRHYWFSKSLDSAVEQTVSELRQVQQQTVAESHPLVFGAWFQTDVQDDQYAVLKFDPNDTSTASDDECTQVGSPRTFENRVVITEVQFDPAPGIGTTCNSVVPAGSEQVFFYARGTATEGELTLFHDETGKSATVTVSGMTARVEEQQ